MVSGMSQAAMLSPSPAIACDFSLLMLASLASASRAVADVQCWCVRLCRWQLEITALLPPTPTETRGLQPVWRVVLAA